MTSSEFIPVNEPLLGERELEYVTECIRTGWISSAGRFIETFEEQWAKYCGRQYGIAVSNGTVALQLAVAALHLPPGSEIILPDFTIISCATAVVFNNCVPVLVDADPVTFCMDVSQVEAKITARTKAIMPVHIYGHPVDMDPLLALAEKYQLAIIEDAAEVHGAQYLSHHHNPTGEWLTCGGIGTISTFSFYANKLITTGEGGMLLTDDAEIAERARQMRNLCFLPGRRFYHEELGFNFRLTNLQAALGVAQLERMDEIVTRKRQMGVAYTERLKHLKGIQLPIEAEWAKHVYWMYALVLAEDTGLDAAEFARHLKKEGVDTRPFFLGMHEQPALHAQGLFNSETYPVSRRIARQGVYLPSGLAITEEQIDRVATSVQKVLAQ